MIELRKFKFSLGKRQSLPFDFERASVDLLAKHKYRGRNSDSMVPSRGWYLHTASHVGGVTGQGGARHG